MANFLQLIAGAANEDFNNPIRFGLLGLVFDADGLPHACGWNLYTPPSVVLASATALTLRLSFTDPGLGAGSVPLTLARFAFTNTGLLSSGSEVVTITVPNVPNTIFYEDVDMTGWLPSGTIYTVVQLSRDSSNPADTFASDLGYFNGRTL